MLFISLTSFVDYTYFKITDKMLNIEIKNLIRASVK